MRGVQKIGERRKNILTYRRYECKFKLQTTKTETIFVGAKDL